MHLALFVADRHIFAWPESVRAEAVTALVVGIRGLVVVEHPAPMLSAPRVVDQKTVFIHLTFPKSSDAAMITVVSPEFGVDMTIAVERSYEFVTMSRGALGKLPGTSEIEPDTFECVRQGGHGLVSLMPIMPPIKPRSLRTKMPWVCLAISSISAAKPKALQ